MISTSIVGPKVFMSAVEPGGGASQTAFRRISVSEEDGITIVRFNDKKFLDEAPIQQVGEELFSLANSSFKFILDFTNVEYMASSFLGKLITFKNKTKAAGAQLVLCNIHPQIYEVFKITGINRKVFESKIATDLNGAKDMIKK